MPRLGPRRPLELGRSVIEFRLTAADADIKALLESEANISATIRKALRLYALYRRGHSGGAPLPEETPSVDPDPSTVFTEAAGVVLDSLEANWS